MRDEERGSTKMNEGTRPVAILAQIPWINPDGSSDADALAQTRDPRVKKQPDSMNGHAFWSRRSFLWPSLETPLPRLTSHLLEIITLALTCCANTSSVSLASLSPLGMRSGTILDAPRIPTSPSRNDAQASSG
eukprot:3524184-Pyramimonas_sp.AAC.1